MTHCLNLLLYSRRSLRLCFGREFFFFPLCYSEFGNFYCSTFQFTDSFLCFFHSTDKLIHAVLISAIVLTVLKFPFGSSLYFLFFWLRFYFSFVKCVCICSLKHFCYGYFKSLLANSNIFVAISLLSSVQSLSHVGLCDPTDCSTPDFPVHHQFRELTQTHVH